MAAFDLDFALRQGGFTLDIKVLADVSALAFFGPSGSGKTTALEAIAGLRVPHHGHIAVNGRRLFERAGHLNVPARRRRVGYVPQEVLLFPHLDVRGNVNYSQREGTRPDDPAIIDLLELGPLMERRVDSLSGGERQRVAIARALRSAPDVLLLDEPLAAVDAARRSKIVTALSQIRTELELPLVYVTHSPEEVRTLADHVVVLDGGRVALSGDPREVLR